MTFLRKIAGRPVGLRLLPLLLLFAPVAVQAATVTANYLGQLDGLNVRRTINGTTTGSTSVGIFHFQQTGGSYSLPESHFYAFCIEPFEAVATGVHTFGALQTGTTNIGGMGVARADQLRELYGRFAPVLHADLLDALDARALQVATWEIVRETNAARNVLSGNTLFSHVANDAGNDAARTAVYIRANVMLSTLTGDPSARLNNYYALTRIGNQDVVVQSTPEPSTLILMALGLAASLFVRRRLALNALVPVPVKTRDR